MKVEQAATAGFMGACSSIEGPEKAKQGGDVHVIECNCNIGTTRERV